MNEILSARGDSEPTEMLQMELNGHAHALLTFLIPVYIIDVINKQKTTDKFLKELDLVLYSTGNYSPDEIPNLKIRLVPKDLHEPIISPDGCQLSEITISVPLAYIRQDSYLLPAGDMSTIDDLDIDMAMIHFVTTSTDKDHPIQLVLSPTSFKPYTRLENLYIEYSKGDDGVEYISKIRDSLNKEGDLSPEAEAPNELAETWTVHRQLEYAKFLLNLLESGESLRIANQSRNEGTM